MGAQQAEHVEHAAQCPRGVGAAAETEDEQPVAGLVLGHDEGIRIGQSAAQAVPESQADDFVQNFASFVRAPGSPLVPSPGW